MWAPMSGGKLRWTVLTTQTAIDLTPNSLALQSTFLVKRYGQIKFDKNAYKHAIELMPIDAIPVARIKRILGSSFVFISIDRSNSVNNVPGR